MVIPSHRMVLKSTYFSIWWKARHGRCGHSCYELSVTWANHRDIRASDSQGPLACLGTMVLLLTPLWWRWAPQGAPSQGLSSKPSHCPAVLTKPPSLSARPGAGKRFGQGWGKELLRRVWDSEPEPGWNNDKGGLRSKAAQGFVNSSELSERRSRVQLCKRNKANRGLEHKSWEGFSPGSQVVFLFSKSSAILSVCLSSLFKDFNKMIKKEL